MDIELAQLLGDDAESSQPDFSDLFKDGGNNPPEEADTTTDKEELNDISPQNFPKITHLQREPAPIFLEKNFYSRVLAGGNEQSERIHQSLQRYLKSKNPDERSVIRQQLIPAWWELAGKIASNFPRVSAHKRLALRFGYLLPQLLSDAQRRTIASIIPKNNYGEPIHYVDEWLDILAQGEINPLASDEVNKEKKSRRTSDSSLVEKARTARETNLGLLSSIAKKRLKMEIDLSTKLVPSIVSQVDYGESQNPYSESQKSDITTTMRTLKKLLQNDVEMRRCLDKIQNSENQIKRIEDDGSNRKGEESREIHGNLANIMEKEIASLRQIAKLCIGRQGNHFPFLMKSFFSPEIGLLGTRENVIRLLGEVETFDTRLFIRQNRNQINRIVPHVIIIPCFGDYGVCWEAFERVNKATSRGRVAIPMFPRNLHLAVIHAMGDLRWNMAKEKAAHYWMEEGLTGHYYQCFMSMKKRGDVRTGFLKDYLLWITKESQGIQKLDSKMRAIFWRFIPFNEETRTGLRKRGFVYDELYKKDMNRSLSDGY